MSETGQSPKTNLNLELYRIAIQTRNMEIDLFWRRSNYFLILNTAIAFGFFTKNNSDDYAWTFGLLGIFASLLWFHVNLGSKYWQTRWEQRCKILENEIAPDADLFASGKAITDMDVRNHLNHFAHGNYRRPLDEYMVRFKPSVSFCMILLSAGFVVIWIFVLIASLGDTLMEPSVRRDAALSAAQLTFLVRL